ncbi:MAG: sn-glycerol-3-phosphate ABC transporter ATP-binding protein UgpC [Verrucomicrobiota bacterium]
MAKVVLENVYKIYAGDQGKDVTAVEDVNLTIEDREFMVFVGPSGCGKSTTLRMIAGLEDISKGSVFIDGKRVNDVQPKDRDIAMVFQNYALYPHMTVYKNMAFGLELRKVPQAEIDKRVRDAAQILGLTDEMLQRKPKALSGGQRQRVAVGRAIVRQPKAFLFDEPLSNLDAKMRVQMRTEISKLHTRLASTMIYVTHDQVEAMTMGDRITVMKNGRIQQVAPPLEIYRNPANMFVAGFIGSPPMNFVEGKILEKSGVLYFVENTANGTPGALNVKLEESQAKSLQRFLGKTVMLGIRAESLEDKIYSTDSNPDHTFKATVEVVEPMGSETYLYVNTGSHSLVARSQIQNRSEVGHQIELVVRMKSVHFFEMADKAAYRKATGELDIETWGAYCPRIA